VRGIGCNWRWQHGWRNSAGCGREVGDEAPAASRLSRRDLGSEVLDQRRWPPRWGRVRRSSPKLAPTVARHSLPDLTPASARRSSPELASARLLRPLFLCCPHGSSTPRRPRSSSTPRRLGCSAAAASALARCKSGLPWSGSELDGGGPGPDGGERALSLAASLRGAGCAARPLLGRGAAASCSSIGSPLSTGGVDLRPSTRGGGGPSPLSVPVSPAVGARALRLERRRSAARAQRAVAPSSGGEEPAGAGLGQWPQGRGAQPAAGRWSPDRRPRSFLLTWRDERPGNGPRADALSCLEDYKSL